MVTLDQLRERVRSRVHTAAQPWGELEDDIVLATVLQLGLVVSDTTGEVYDPAPKPVINYPHDQNGVHYSGQVRRRRYRR